MPTLKRPDGVDIHWEEQGDGPLVVFCPFWSSHPSGLETLKSQLAAEHRVVWYDARGTGESTRVGPFDLETMTADLAALLEELGGNAVVFAMADTTNHAIRVAARQPELCKAVIIAVGSPLGRETLEEPEQSGLAGSAAVVDAFRTMLETDYRGALRTMMSTNNAQMTEDEVRGRVNLQAEYIAQEVALERMNAWFEDEAQEEARGIGDRLWSFHYRSQPWFGIELMHRLRKELPDAHFVELPDGPVTCADEHVELLRDIARDATRIEESAQKSSASTGS